MQSSTDDEKGNRFEDHDWVLQQLEKAVEADKDNRDHGRECQAFIHTRNGQWEQSVYNQFDGQPRYTFDHASAIIDQITGEIDRRDFDIAVLPAGGDATKDTAKTYDGLIRNIENISKAGKIYSAASRNSTIGVLSGWRVVHDYINGDSFDQDLIIEKISNFVDRVWFGPHDEPDASDAQMCWVMTGLTKAEYEDEYPDRAEGSLEPDREIEHRLTMRRDDLVYVGEFLYLQDENRELVKMSNEQVYVVDEDFERVKDELEEAGITEVARRTRKVKRLYTREFDINGWIGKPEPTIFYNWLTVVPLYANFTVIEDQPVHYGAVEKLLDPCRVLNYSLSREISEGALAPRGTYWATAKQAEGMAAEWAGMNTDNKPVRLFNHDPDEPGPPKWSGGAQVNPGLRNITVAMQESIGNISGMFAANMGDNPGLQSGVAIGKLQDRGDVGSNKFIEAREIAQAHTARILVNAIPRVYTPGRQVRVLMEDGSYNMVTLGETVVDRQTNQLVTLNDLGVGQYDVVCTSGKSFKNRQSETVESITELGKVDASIVEMGGDIILNNIPTPGMEQLSARKRQQLINAGLVPEEQLTDEEKAKIAQAQQQNPPQEDPMMVAARAEEAKGQADIIKAQTDQMKAQADIEFKRIDKKIAVYNAETARLKAQLAAAELEEKVPGLRAKAMKDAADAEGQDIDNTIKAASALSGMVPM